MFQKFNNQVPFPEHLPARQQNLHQQCCEVLTNLGYESVTALTRAAELKHIKSLQGEDKYLVALLIAIRDQTKSGIMCHDDYTNANNIVNRLITRLNDMQNQVQNIILRNQDLSIYSTVADN